MASHIRSHAGRSQTASYDTIVSWLAQQDKVPWYRKPTLRLLYLIMLPTCFGVEMTSGFDSSMLNGLQAVPSWLEYFHHPRSVLLGLMAAMYSLGGFVSIPFVPFVVDNFGRRYSILLGSIFMIIGSSLQGVALNYEMFCAGRFVMGLGNIVMLVAASSLTGELSHPKERAIMNSLFNACFMIGSISAAAVTLRTFSVPNNWGWRIPSLLQAMPSLLQVSLIWFLPESPRWLIAKGRRDEAFTILVKYHAEGDEDSEFVKAEYAQIEQTLTKEMRNAQMSWTEMLSTRGMRRRVLIASFLALLMKWSGNSLVSYFLPPVLDNIGICDNRTKNIINFSRAGWNLATCIILALIVPRYPRRKVYLASTISVLVVLCAWTAASAEYARTHSMISSHAVLVLIFLHSPAYHAGFTALIYTYLVELFPFHARARGIAVFQWWCRIGAIVAQLIDPIGIEAAGWRYYLAYCVWITFGVAFIYIVFPETSGRTLEELTFLFEGDDRGQEIPRSVETEPLLHEHSGMGEAYDATENSSRKVSDDARQA